MASNYPPGVTGNEFAIAGPDYEKESDTLCPECLRENMMELGYGGGWWLACGICDYATDLEPLEPDPDSAYDEARERRLFGEEG